jgi:hypothetical protein
MRGGMSELNCGKDIADNPYLASMPKPEMEKEKK